MTVLKEVIITDIDEFDSVDVVEVHVKEGDHIDVDQPLVTLESDKAMMDFPSPYQGVVKKLNVSEGGQVKEGDCLVSLEVQEDASEPSHKIADSYAKNKSEEAKPNSSAEPIAPPSQQTPSGGVAAAVTTVSNSAYASPGVQKYARELGVDIHQVTGSGRKHRVIQTDVQQYVSSNLNKSSVAQSSIATKPLDFSAYGEIETKDLTKIQRVTITNMLNAWQNIPHVTHFDQADVTLLERHRKQLANELKEKNIKLTPLAFVIKALVASLKQYPTFNTSLDTFSEKLVFKKFFHIGIAVDTPHGLLVPVIRDVDKKTITQVAAELIELSELARSRKLTREQMSGASMTVSSLGILGGQAFTPIINPPEVAILGVSKMIVNEKVTEKGVEQQKLLPLSLSYDHRVINGADAARFCTHLIGVLEDIWKLIL